MFSIKKELFGKIGNGIFILCLALSMAVWSCGNESGGDDSQTDQTEMESEDSEHPDEGSEHPNEGSEHPAQDSSAADSTEQSEHPDNSEHPNN